MDNGIMIIILAVALLSSLAYIIFLRHHKKSETAPLFPFYDQFSRLVDGAAEQLFNQINYTNSLLLSESNRHLLKTHPNPLNRAGFKIYSQNEEDGITFEILRRIGIGIGEGVFAEFGVGDGMENNTIALAALGWKGFWAGGEDLAFDVAQYAEGQSKVNFMFMKSWIMRENVLSLMQHAMNKIGEDQIDVVSLDLDGNDYYIAEELLQSGVKPKLFIVEYNAKFAPPVRWKIDYDPEHRWKGDDYFGASLCSFNDLFEKHGYILVCCNANSGSNAFFVQSAYKDVFSDVPQDVRILWSPPCYFIHPKYGHTSATRSVELIFKDLMTRHEMEHS